MLMVQGSDFGISNLALEDLLETVEDFCQSRLTVLTRVDHQWSQYKAVSYVHFLLIELSVLKLNAQLFCGKILP